MLSYFITFSSSGSLVEACFEFIMASVQGDSNTMATSADTVHLSQFDCGLFSRTFKRLVKKLHSKYPLPTRRESTIAHDSDLTREKLPEDESVIYPLSGHDKLNYLRLLDVRNSNVDMHEVKQVTLTCLLLMEIKLAYPPFPEDDMGEAEQMNNNQKTDRNADLRRELHICLRELFTVLFVYW